ncbi:hypothetical protein TIFTF001_034707 [Ficus carica]|uniref:Uncharacterized protein n=1 Tax=Ficus carica TaxID=3494 RepID=A0AA88E8C9_FICCA|nr:hypothetical protein TIFTF001_034707 [Ficus carica]
MLWPWRIRNIRLQLPISTRKEERTGRYGTPRLQYLLELVTQFQSSTNEGVFCCVYHVFIGIPCPYCITEPNEKLVEFGIGGVCNSCAGRSTKCCNNHLMLRNPSCGSVFIKPGRKTLLFNLYNASAQVNYALGALYYLCNKYNRKEILKPAAAEAVTVSFNLAGDPCENDHDLIRHSPTCDSVAGGHPNPDSPQRPSPEKTTSSGCRRPQEQTTCVLNRDFVTILTSCEFIFIMGVDL